MQVAIADEYTMKSLCPVAITITNLCDGKGGRNILLHKQLVNEDGGRERGTKNHEVNWGQITQNTGFPYRF